MAATSDSVAENGNMEPLQSALIFLGTGCSSAVPNALCLIKPSDPPCHVCSQALSIPPAKNPNYRSYFGSFWLLYKNWISCLSKCLILLLILGNCLYFRRCESWRCVFWSLIWLLHLCLICFILFVSALVFYKIIWLSGH